MPQYSVRSHTPAPIATVWKLLQDGRSWPVWSTVLDELVAERSNGLGPDGLDGVGAVRAFRVGRVVSGERLSVVEAPHHLGYEDVFNPALRDYRADVRLAEAPEGGTSVHWSGHYRMKPLVGWVLPWILPRTMQRMADDLAAGATQRFRSDG